MNTNDDKTIIGESSFNTPNNESNTQNNQGETQKAPNQKEPTQNAATSKIDKSKVSRGAAIGGAAVVGVAAAVGGVAAGTAYSEEIKEKYNELIGADNNISEAENTTETTDTVETATTDLHSEILQTQDFETITHQSSPDSGTYSEPLAEQDEEVRIEFTDESGNVNAINLIDFDQDGVADSIQLITNDEVVAEVTGEEFGDYLTGSEYDSDAMPEVIDSSLGEGEDNIAYESIDYANFEDGTIQPMDETLLASDESLAANYISDPSISLDYAASAEDYTLESDVSSENYSLESEISSEDYLAPNENYQIELDNTDFDNTDYSTDSFNTGFSDDLI